MELNIWITLNGYGDATFEIFRTLYNSEELEAQNSILVLDYKWTPWTRKEGNLLW